MLKYCHLPTEMVMKVPILYFMRTQILISEYGPFEKIIYIPENTATDSLA